MTKNVTSLKKKVDPIDPATHVFSKTEIKIIEAYLSLTERIGVADATLQRVADEGNFAFGTVRYHFAADKALDLTQAAILYVGRSGQQFIEAYVEREQQKAGYNGVKAYIEGTFQWIQKQSSHSSFLIYFYYLGNTQKDLIISNELFLQKARSRILHILRETIGIGLYKPLKNLEGLVLQIHALLMGTAIIASSQRSKKEYKLQCEMALRACDTLIRNAEQN